jgi:hypothetical protein
VFMERTQASLKKLSPTERSTLAQLLLTLSEKKHTSRDIEESDVDRA